MRHPLDLVVLLPVLAAATSTLPGCAPPAPPTANAGTLGPHKGALLKLPFGHGFAEVVVESTGAAGKPPTTEVAAYFFAPDATTPLSPPPTDVTFLLYLAESKTSEKVPLKPGAQPNRFAAVPPAGFDGIIINGTLAAQVGGQEVVARY